MNSRFRPPRLCKILHSGQKQCQLVDHSGRKHLFGEHATGRFEQNVRGLKIRDRQIVINLLSFEMQSEYGSNACGPRMMSRSQAVLWLQGITVLWMVIECGVSLLAAARAHSPALLAFGSDSLVELLSAALVLLQFTPRLNLRLSCRNYADRPWTQRRFQIGWFDSAAALIAVPLLLKEGREAVARTCLPLSLGILVPCWYHISRSLLDN
jgi:hypothetical protein